MQQITLLHTDFFCQFIAGNIFNSYSYRSSINIHRFNCFSTKFSSSNSQNSRASTNIKYFHISTQNFFQTFHTHTGRMMCSCTKRHTWIDFNNMFTSFRCIFFPGRLNHQCSANMRNMEILFPFVSPILLGNSTKTRITKATFTNTRFQICQVLINLCKTWLQLFILRIISSYRNHFCVFLLRNIA